MPERRLTFTNYRFGFNTQEKLDEISGSGTHNTALYWEYDTRLSRRWNLDPKPTASETQYSSMRGNPIWFKDFLGDVVTGDKNGKELYDKGRQKIKNNINSITNKIAEITNKSSSGLSNNDQRRITRLTEKLDAFRSADAELDKMEQSEYLFNITTSGSSSNQDVEGETKTHGVRAFDVQIYNGSIGTLFHELKHGSQFLEGKLAFDLKTGVGLKGMLDREDEMEAKNRQILLTSGIPNYYKNDADLITDFPKYSTLPKGQHTIWNTKFSELDPTYKGNDLFIQYVQNKLIKNDILNYVDYHKVEMRKNYEDK